MSLLGRVVHSRHSDVEAFVFICLSDKFLGHESKKALILIPLNRSYVVHS